MLDTMGCQMDGEVVSAWLRSDDIDPGFQTYTDDKICELVMQEESVEHEQEKEDEVEEICFISNGAAVCMFEQTLRWSEQHQPEANTYNTSLLRKLGSLAAQKRWQSLKQTNIVHYTNNK